MMFRRNPMRRGFPRWRFISRDIQRRFIDRSCGYCGRKVWPLARVGICYDGRTPAHLRCCGRGRMPFRVA